MGVEFSWGRTYVTDVKSGEASETRCLEYHTGQFAMLHPRACASRSLPRAEYMKCPWWWRDGWMGAAVLVSVRE